MTETKYGHLTVNQRCRAERKDYREFIERLAQTELGERVGISSFFCCPRCDGAAVFLRWRQPEFKHDDDCPVWGARCLLGMKTDERGNLAEVIDDSR